MKNWLKDNIMLIILVVVIVWSTLEITNSLKLIWDDTGEMKTQMSYFTPYSLQNSLENIKDKLDNANDRLKSIDLAVDGSLDDVVYYLSK